MTASEHLYFHVPFCSGKCTYCGFYSVPYNPALADKWLNALQQELASFLPQPSDPITIYFGGGTPSILPAHQLDRFLNMIRNSINTVKLQEWTIEANPGTLTPEKLKLLQEAGVNRISLGVQTMNDSILAQFKRRHTQSDTVSTINLLRDTGFDNFGLDLIAGLPAVSTSQWRRELEDIIAFQPRHISVYALSLEPDSALKDSVDRKQIILPDEDAQLDAIHLADDLLSAAGWLRYEISNYAQPGFECRHNLDFWRGGDYLGFGPAAASRSGLTRRTNLPDLSAYISTLSTCQPPPSETETLSHEKDIKERIAFAFRLSEGVEMKRFSDPSATETLSQLALEGLVESADERWRLTRIGRDFADHVLQALI